MSTPGRAAAGRRPDESMSLLLEAARNPVDPGYAAAAARPADAPGRRRALGAAAGLLVAAMMMGTVWAARELRAPEPDVLEARSLLEAEVTERVAAARELQDEVGALGAEVDALAGEALQGADGPAALGTLGPAAGTVPVAGPGVVVTLTDSPQAAAGDPDAADGRVNYIDLQVLTNGLWQAGAEAIAINGHRLTALSAVRFAGEAILVELSPLVGPYRVEAIGDPDDLRAGLARTAASRHLALLRDTYGIGVDVTQTADLSMPAVPLPTLRLARPTGDDVPTGSGDVPAGSGDGPAESTTAPPQAPAGAGG